MTDDLVGRLKRRSCECGWLATDPPRPSHDMILYEEAADRIDALEDALRQCAEAPFSGWTIAQSIARAALAKDKSDG